MVNKINRTRAGVAVAMAVTLMVAGCGGGGKPAGSSTTSSGSATQSSAAAAPETQTLSPDEAKNVGIPDATAPVEVTVVPEATDAPGAEQAPADAPENASAGDLADAVAKDAGISPDTAAADAVEFVTVSTPDGKWSVEVPAAWSYVNTKNGLGQPILGAVDGNIEDDVSQRVVVGSRANGVDDTLAGEAGYWASQGCTASVTQPYTDSRLTGKSQTYKCPAITIVTLVVSMLDPNTPFEGFFAVRVKDATGIAMLERAIGSFKVTA